MQRNAGECKGSIVGKGMQGDARGYKDGHERISEGGEMEIGAYTVWLC
jgi:hypothetical protein